MPKSVTVENLNPGSDYPICRFQVVNYTDGEEVKEEVKESITGNGFLHTSAETSGNDTRPMTVSEMISEMHKRASALVQRMADRRQVKPRQKQSTRGSEQDEKSRLSIMSLPAPLEPISVDCSTSERVWNVDSGGMVHGPMDQKHSTRLGNVSRNMQKVQGSRQYLTSTAEGHRWGAGDRRRQSESGVWDVNTEMHHAYNTSSGFRGRTYSESRQPLSSDRYFSQQTNPQHYRTTASYLVGDNQSPPTRISRWSSMQNTYQQTGWPQRGSSTGRYSTTLTRKHVKRGGREPVEVLVKHPPSAGASRVDLVSIDNRRGVSPTNQYYSPGRQYESVERERQLCQEVVQIRRELEDLKRTRSVTAIDHQSLASPPVNVVTTTSVTRPQRSTSNQYLNEERWTTHALRRTEGQPCGAPFSIRAGRTASQTHISGPQSMPANRYASEINLLTTETHRQQSQPYHSTYSAHRENQRRMEEERRRVEAFKASNQHIVENRQVGGGQELTEEMETIALQPIGKGIHDLEPSVETMMRHSRAMTPTPGYTTNVDGTENYRTLASTVTTGNWTREGQMSRDHMYYPTDGRTPLSRNLSTYEGQVQSGQNSQPGLLMDNVSAKLLQQVDASSQDWYMPYVSRNEVCALLRDKEPGSFIVRISQSFKNHFSLGLKIPHDSPNFQLRPTDAASGYVRYFLISPVTLPDGKGNGLAFNGFSNSPAFSSLITLVADHVMHPRHLPCPLRLPDSARGMGSAHMNAGHNYGSTHTAMNCTSTLDHPSYLSGEAFTTPMLFLGTVEIGPNINSESVENGITRMLNQPSSLEKREVYVKFIPREGMKMVDRDGTLVKKAIKAEHIAWVGMDPRGRDFSDPELYAKGMRNAKIFAVVVKKPTAIMTKRNVYAFCERTPSQPAFSLVHYMRSLYPGQ